MAESQVKPVDILLAEDDDDDYLIFTVALRETLINFKLSRAVDGDVLLKILKENLPDILFLDLQMPCKDGHHCLKEIRADKRYDSLPIIIYSAMSDESNIDRCYRAGANFYAIKEGSFGEIKATLQQILVMQWKTSLYYPTKSEFVLRKDAIN